MFCVKCGNQIKDGYKFCPKCGTPAYVEKEKPKSEVKKEIVDEVATELNVSVDSKPVVMSTETVMKKAKANTASKLKKKDQNTTNYDFIPNPMIEEELDIEDLKEMAEQGNEYAILRLAFRYELGIGVDKDVERAKVLYSKTNQRYTTCNTLLCDIIAKHLCVTKKQSEEYFKDDNSL